MLEDTTSGDAVESTTPRSTCESRVPTTVEVLAAMRSGLDEQRGSEQGSKPEQISGVTDVSMFHACYVSSEVTKGTARGKRVRVGEV